MGIRVVKVIGYGLTDIKREKSGLWCDPRIKDDFILGGEDLTPEGFVEYLSKLPQKDSMDILLLSQILTNGYKDEDLNNCLAHDYESEESKNLVIIPPEYLKESRRYDDLIDYYECPYGEKVTLLDRPIYPYDSWMDSRTGEPVKNAHDTMQVVKIYQETPEVDQPNEYLKTQGYESYQEFKKIVVPKVPMSVRLFCEYAGIFKDPKTVFSLRPMIYSYWS